MKQIACLLLFCGYMEILWIHAKSNRKRQHFKWFVHETKQYTQYVKGQLSVCPLPGNLGSTSSTAEFRGNMAGLHDLVTGVVVCQRDFSPTVLSHLNQQQMEIRDSWHLSQFSGEPLAFFRILDAYPLDQPRCIYDSMARLNKNGMFFKPTQISLGLLLSARLANRPAHDPKTTREIIDEWRNTYGLEFDDAESAASVCMTLPIPYSVLVVNGIWSSYAFPIVPSKHRAALGFRFVSSLWKPFERTQQTYASAPDAQYDFGPEALQTFYFVSNVLFNTIHDGWMAGRL